MKGAGQGRGTMNISRRRFLGQAGCAGMSAIPLLNTILNLKLAGSVAAAEPGPGEYRALVCVFLNGGWDSFNLLVPRGASEYAEYAAVRQDLALPQASLLPINPVVDPGRLLGLHPGLTEIQTLFEAGQAAFVANVGTLVQNVNKNDYDQGANLPLGLFSHSDQAEQWQSSLPDTRSAVGWAGRMADLLKQLKLLKGNTFSLTGTLYQGLSVELGYTSFTSGYGNYALGSNEKFVKVSYNIAIGSVNRANRPRISDSAYSFDSMADKRFEKVRRENRIIKAVRNNGSFTVSVSGF